MTRSTITAVVCAYAWSRDPSLAKTFVLVIDEGAKTVLMSTAANFDTTFGRALNSGQQLADKRVGCRTCCAFVQALSLCVSCQVF